MMPAVKRANKDVYNNGKDLIQMETYNYKNIEKKWQDRWEEAGIFHASNNSEKEKIFGLVEFPYP